MRYLFMLLVLAGLNGYGQTKKTVRCNTWNQLYYDFDKFNGEVTVRTYSPDRVRFIKRFTEKDTTIYCMLQTDINGYSTGKGITILFADGKRIERPEEIVETEITSPSNYAWSMFQLTSDEVEIFKNNKITDYKLYIYSEENIKNPDRYSLLFNCILNCSKDAN